MQLYTTHSLRAKNSALVERFNGKLTVSIQYNITCLELYTVVLSSCFYELRRSSSYYIIKQKLVFNPIIYSKYYKYNIKSDSIR
jgi:hypothetical protein